MLFQFILLPLALCLYSSMSLALKPEPGMDKIIELIKSKNIPLQTMQKLEDAYGHIETGSAYYPDPNVKISYFLSPIETRNGPQRFNLMISQSIPWPSSLNSEQLLASHSTEAKKHQKELFLLELIYNTKLLIFKNLELRKKQANKQKMAATLSKLNNVVLGRLKLGRASQAEISQINIEIAKLSQAMRLISSKQMDIKQKLRSMTGGENIEQLLPDEFNTSWQQLNGFDPSQLKLEDHPAIKLANAKVKRALAVVERQKSKRLPKLGASISWFQIDPTDSVMPNSDSGKDAFAIAASVSLPIWSGKYDAMEHGNTAKLTAVQLELKQTELELKTQIASIYEEFIAAGEVSSIYANDIIPQAVQALESDRESYTQSGVTFEKVISNYIRVIKFEDLLIESQVKQAILKAYLQKLAAMSL